MQRGGGCLARAGCAHSVVVVRPRLCAFHVNFPRTLCVAGFSARAEPQRSHSPEWRPRVVTLALGVSVPEVSENGDPHVSLLGMGHEGSVGAAASAGLGKGCWVVGPAGPSSYQPASPAPEINSQAGSVLGFILCSNRCEHSCSVLMVMYDTAYKRFPP